MAKDLTKLSTKELAAVSGANEEDLTIEQWWYLPEDDALERKAG